ncbi:hypothetical protein GCM10011391_07980 [Pullulanibacillus camelliae]|uniref:Peptidase M28 domain-containing protein n=1 Tax=Pullulanibacillus camelliae TaxID=1707096 RepID=A0A8J2YFC7_9BACL|nr:M28 family peptidase [Pullulanibacillus camelliae]GGE31722.1 hypothetical protein GCM10011391_07980 [Pullulanibacillus camelliae]
MTEEEKSVLLSEVNLEEMDNLLKVFSHLNRLSGEQEAEQAAQFILNKLDAYGILYEKQRCDLYVSNPIFGELSIIESDECIQAKTRSFSAHCPDGRKGTLLYDPYSKSKETLTPMEEKKWYTSVKDKIVVSWNGYEDYVKKVEKYGAMGVVHIWPSSEPVIHEETVGPIWGAPSLETIHDLPVLPVIGIGHAEGLALLEKMEQGMVSARIKTRVETKCVQATLPIAHIPGRSTDYVLLSSHYDSWHEGMTDNAVGNALCLEVARILSLHTQRLERGLKVAWWPGHSNARYGGSTWYCDHNWQDLQEHCVAHINVDSPGSKGGDALLVNRSGVEDVGFIDEVIRSVTGQSPKGYSYLKKGADQSFWGVDIPVHIALKNVPSADIARYHSPGSGGGWWWHTEEDTYDKVDHALLLRDTQIHLLLVERLLSLSCLPLELNDHLKNMKQVIAALDASSDSDLSFQSVFSSLEALTEAIKQLGSQKDDGDKACLQQIGGHLNQLIYSYSDPYRFDIAYMSGPFPGFQVVKQIYRETTPETQYLFIKTFFVRQCNRWVNEVKRMIEQFKDDCELKDA